MAIAKVEPLTTARALRGPFDYLLPERLAGVGVGSVLLVPFGRRRVLGRRGRGRRVERAAPERLAEPIRALEAGATPELVRLGLWVAREYCSTPARGLELVLPPGIGRDGQGVGPRLELMVAPTEAGRAALSRRHPPRTPPARRARGAGREGPLPSGEIPASELEAGAAVTRETLKRLEARGLVALRARERRRRPSVAAVGAPSHQPRLAPQQQRALAEIVAAIDGGAPRELLLHGVTGSGKTEVYLAAAEAALAAGEGLDRAGARDRAHAADRGSLRKPLR